MPFMRQKITCNRITERGMQGVQLDESEVKEKGDLGSTIRDLAYRDEPGGERYG